MKKRRIYTQSLPLTSCQEEDPPPGPGLCGPVLWYLGRVDPEQTRPNCLGRRALVRIQWNTGEAGVESLLSPTFSCHTHQPVRGGVARDKINGSWASNRHRRLQSTVETVDARLPF